MRVPSEKVLPQSKGKNRPFGGNRRKWPCDKSRVLNASNIEQFIIFTPRKLKQWVSFKSVKFSFWCFSLLVFGVFTSLCFMIDAQWNLENRRFLYEYEYEYDTRDLSGEMYPITGSNVMGRNFMVHDLWTAILALELYREISIGAQNLSLKSAKDTLNRVKDDSYLFIRHLWLSYRHFV